MAITQSEQERVLIQGVMAELLARDVDKRRPTIAEVLRRTDLARWKLTHKHRDLNDHFLAAVARRWGFLDPGPSVHRRKLEHLQARNKQLNEEVRSLRRSLQHYAEALEELRIQNSELQQHGERRVTNLAARRVAKGGDGL